MLPIETFPPLPQRRGPEQDEDNVSKVETKRKRTTVFEFNVFFINIYLCLFLI